MVVQKYDGIHGHEIFKIMSYDAHIKDPLPYVN